MTKPTPKARSAKKRHAARKTRAAALSFSVVATGGMAAAFAMTDPGDDPINTPVSEIAATPTSTTLASQTTPHLSETPESEAAASAEAAASTSFAPTPTNSRFADGTFIGSSVGTEWGPVQVSITTAHDQIVAVDILAMPDDDRKSRRINAEAGPSLVSDALAIQTAEVDVVSGATYTSRAYQDSLQAAMDDAAIALNGRSSTGTA